MITIIKKEIGLKLSKEKQEWIRLVAVKSDKNFSSLVEKFSLWNMSKTLYKN